MNKHFSSSWFAGSATLLPERVKQLPQGELTIRPIDLADLELEVEFLEALSLPSRYQRMLGTVSFKSLDRVRELLDYRMGPAMALGAILNDGVLDRRGRSKAQLIGVARYAPTEQSGVAEMAVVLADRFQGDGLGSLLLERLHLIASAYGYRELNALTFANNRPMLALAYKLGYSNCAEPGDGSLRRINKPLLVPAGEAPAGEAPAGDEAQRAGLDQGDSIDERGSHEAQNYLDQSVNAMLGR